MNGARARSTSPPTRSVVEVERRDRRVRDRASARHARRRGARVRGPRDRGSCCCGGSRPASANRHAAPTASGSLTAIRARPRCYSTPATRLIRSYWRMSLVLGDAQDADRAARARPAIARRRAGRGRDPRRRRAELRGDARLRADAAEDLSRAPLARPRPRPRPQPCRGARPATVVGFLLARRWAQEGIGFVDVLGVHPDHQRARGRDRAAALGLRARFRPPDSIAPSSASRRTIPTRAICTSASA